MNKDVAQLIDRINATPGYVVSDEQTGGGHWQAFRADANGEPVGRGVTLPSTPGDPNHLNVSRKKLRRLLGWHDPITRSGQKRQRTMRTTRPPRTARKDQDMATIREIVRVTGDEKKPSLQSSTRDVARFVWGQLKNAAAGESGSAMQHMGVPGYRWTGRLVNVMCGFWPELSGLSDKERNYTVQRVRDVLTQQSKRMVVIRQGNPSVPTTWFIRAAWDVDDDTPVRPVESKVSTELQPAGSARGGVNEVMPKASVAQTVASRGAVRDDGVSPATSSNIGVEDMLAFLARYDALSQEHDALIEPFRRLSEAMDEISSILKRGGVTR